MSGLKWIKISTDIFDDEKIRLIEQMPEGDSVLIIWIKLLVLAGKKNAGGEIFVNDEMPYTDEMLATIFHRKIGTVRLALKTFQKFQMVEIIEDQTIVISNWGKYQNLEGIDKIREQNREKQRRYRVKQREQAMQVRLELQERRELQLLPETSSAQSQCGCNDPRNVTDGDGVTTSSVTSPEQNKIENQRGGKKEGNSLSEDAEKAPEADLIQHAIAKRLFGQLTKDVFGKELREDQWSSRMEHDLDDFLPC